MGRTRGGAKSLWQTDDRVLDERLQESEFAWNRCSARRCEDVLRNTECSSRCSAYRALFNPRRTAPPHFRSLRAPADRHARADRVTEFDTADRSGGSSTIVGQRRQALRKRCLECAEVISHECVINHCLTTYLRNLLSCVRKETGGVVTCRPLIGCCVVKRCRSAPV